MTAQDAPRACCRPQGVRRARVLPRQNKKLRGGLNKASPPAAVAVASPPVPPPPPLSPPAAARGIYTFAITHVYLLRILYTNTYLLHTIHSYIHSQVHCIDTLFWHRRRQQSGADTRGVQRRDWQNHMRRGKETAKTGKRQNEMQG